MSNCEYVSGYYKVPACIGRIVTYKGRQGIITKDRGAHIGVTFDDEKPTMIYSFHPETAGLEYHGMGNVRKMTRAQKRYQAYKEYSDCFDSFIDFCRWYDAIGSTK